MSLIACWSAKGGSGTTVVAAGLALLLAERDPAGAVLADLAGDAPAVFGLSTGASPGLSDWLAAGDDVPADAVHRIELTITDRLVLLPRGSGRLPHDRADVLRATFDLDHRSVVADCGTRPRGAAAVLATTAETSLLVTRPCYLALRRATQAHHRPTGIVLVREPGRKLDKQDIERAVGAPVLAETLIDPAVAQAVDAGMFADAPLPRAFARGLRHVL